MTKSPGDTGARLGEIIKILDDCSNLLKRTQGKHYAESLTMSELIEILETVEHDLEVVLGDHYIARFKGWLEENNDSS